MSRHAASPAAWALACLLAVPAAAWAQATPSQTPAPTPRLLWITIGGGATTLKGDCSTCEGNPNYRQAGNLLINAGRRFNARTDGGVEAIWVPATTVAGDDIRTTMLLGVAQFRPWVERGFFLKAGMGIAFVRNWVYDATNDVTPPYITNAMALTYGGGWEFRQGRRLGVQLIGSHHIVALGDFTTDGGTVENVVGNFWSAGAGIVIR